MSKSSTVVLKTGSPNTFHNVLELASALGVVGIPGWIGQKWFKWNPVARVAKVNISWLGSVCTSPYGGKLPIYLTVMKFIMFLKMHVNKMRGCKIWQQISYELKLSEKQKSEKERKPGNYWIITFHYRVFFCCLKKTPQR